MSLTANEAPATAAIKPAPAEKRPVVQTRAIIEDIHILTGLERGDIGRVLTALYTSVAERVKIGQDVELKEFVTVSKVYQAPRERYVPSTEERSLYDAAWHPRAHLARTFKNRL